MKYNISKENLKQKPFYRLIEADIKCRLDKDCQSIEDEKSADPRKWGYVYGGKLEKDKKDYDENRDDEEDFYDYEEDYEDDYEDIVDEDYDNVDDYSSVWGI